MNSCGLFSQSFTFEVYYLCVKIIYFNEVLFIVKKQFEAELKRFCFNVSYLMSFIRNVRNGAEKCECVSCHFGSRTVITRFSLILTPFIVCWSVRFKPTKAIQGSDNPLSYLI